ncbi:MAG: hypothetical protein AB1305_01650 [Candidatus Hadarchaeota archaeon]
MKMKESAGVAISAGVGVFIVIIIAVAGVGAFLVLKGGGGTSSAAFASVPTYPGATDTGISVSQSLAGTGYSMPSGWDGKAYYTTASPSTVASWYSSNMPGWTKTMDNTISYGGFSMYILAFTKGSDAAFVETLSSGTQNLLIVLAGPSSGLSSLTGTSGTIGATQPT